VTLRRPLSVPDEARSGLTQLAGLDDALTDLLFAAIHRQSPRLLHAPFIEAIHDAVPDRLKPTSGSILQALISVSLGREESELSGEDFAWGVANSTDLEIPRPQREGLEVALLRALREPSLVVTAKAWDIQTENQANFGDARIVTEMRPIFVDVADSPVSALIVHELRVTYGNKQEASEFHIALDEVDVIRLIETLNRAQAKAQRLRETLKRIELSVLERERG